MTFKCAAILLAAGQSKRFGTAKQLALTPNKQPLIVHTLTHLLAGFIGDIYPVLGSRHAQISPVIHPLITTTKNMHINKTLIHAGWQNGIGSSIAFAVDTLMSLSLGYTHLLITLADQVALTEQDYRLLMSQAQGNPDKIISSAYHYTDECSVKSINGKLNAAGFGVPAIFPKSFFPQLQKLTRDTGAKKIIKANKAQTHFVQCDNAAIDIDTSVDFERYFFKN